MRIEPHRKVMTKTSERLQEMRQARFGRTERRAEDEPPADQRTGKRPARRPVPKKKS